MMLEMINKIFPATKCTLLSKKYKISVTGSKTKINKNELNCMSVIMPGGGITSIYAPTSFFKFAKIHHSIYN